MTSPTGSDGDIYVNVHANTDPVDPELKAGLEKAARDAEKVMDAAGEHLGEALADSTAEELGKHGKDFTEAIEGGIKKQKINIDGEWFTIDRNGKLHDSAGRFAGKLGQHMAREVGDAFASASRPGGVFSKVGEGIADAIGAGFNISGRSPLILALIPALGAIGTLIVGAIQAVNGLSAALVAVPPLIAAIGLQVTTVALAFDGVGEAMSKAFDAKNAKELREALAGLTPAAREFVKSMLPIKSLFEDLKRTIQESFFQGLGNSIAPMLRTLIEISKGPFAQLAFALGQLFQQLANFFQSKVFVEFVQQIFPATVRWLQKFGPVFVDLLEALTRMATVAIPFLEKLGGLLNKVLIKITNRINEAIESGAMEEWLDRMFLTLETLASVFGDIINFVFAFMQAIDQAGGNRALAKIGEFFERLSFFFSSPVGIKALEGMINAVIVLTEVFGGLIIILSSVFALVQFLLDAIGAFLGWLFGTAIPAIGQFFADIWGAVEEFWFNVEMFFADFYNGFISVVEGIGMWFGRLWEGAVATLKGIIQWFIDLPGKILNAVKDAINWLFDIGRKIIQGLINGMKSMVLDAIGTLGGIGDELKQKMRQQWGIASPSKVTYQYGEAIMAGLEDGMKDNVARLRDTVGDVTAPFTSPDIAIQAPRMDATTFTATQVVNLNMGGLTFDGAVNEQQATTAGKAAAGGAMSQIQQRDTRLLVRMI